MRLVEETFSFDVTSSNEKIKYKCISGLEKENFFLNKLHCHL